MTERLPTPLHLLPAHQQRAPEGHTLQLRVPADQSGPCEALTLGETEPPVRLTREQAALPRAELGMALTGGQSR
ncbi:MAG: hypothetical protein IT307_12615 [Chloroflexi bacterium]|nr:hypothetical protein [Chloroflexota bacterium]